MPESGVRAVAEDYAGLPCIRLYRDPQHSVLVALHGAQVLSWRVNGVEQLYMSPRSVMDGRSAIRGGVPICFPQFNARGNLPKHGFARNLPWQAGVAQRDESGSARLVLSLRESPGTLALWPHPFVLHLTLELGSGWLQLDLSVDNTGQAPLAFMVALHTYLQVHGIGNVGLDGLEGCAVWDAVMDEHSVQSGTIRFEGEYDRVFAAAPRPLSLHDGHRHLHITQSPSMGQTVVWNPGAQRCASLSDMPPAGFEHMLCVEAAQIEPGVLLAPGVNWHGWQRLAVASSRD